MKTMILFVLFCLTGCMTVAGVEARPNDFHYNGYATGKEAAKTLEILQKGHTEQYNAETYRQQVERGEAAPYPTGGYHNAYELYYGEEGISPVLPDDQPRRQMRSAPASDGSDDDGATPDSKASKKELDEVREQTKANTQTLKNIQKLLENQ